MIKHFSLDNISVVAINSLLRSVDFTAALSNCRSLLIQYYSAHSNETRISETLSLLKEQLPHAVIVGASTVGEIIDGRSVTGKDILGFTLFEHSELHPIHYPLIPNKEREIGIQLGQRIKQEYQDVKGVLLLSTPLSTNASELLKGIEQIRPRFQLFGGGAGDYASLNCSLVCCGEYIYEQGVVAVVMTGHELQIESNTYLGWRALSRDFKATKVSGLVLEKIDEEPAYRVYQKYLNLKPNDDFFLNALEFPFLIERNGKLLARVPVDVTENGGLVFVADIKQGEKLVLGYGDPSLILQGAEQAQHNIAEQQPETIFLYSCGCRRFLMQQDVDLETQPLQNIAPTFGFYTYGEFFSEQGTLPLLNSTMVYVSLREGAINQHHTPTNIVKQNQTQTGDPYANKHLRIVSKLVNFINATTQELNQANQTKSQFLANTSHELRTPLTTISGYTEALLNGDIAPENSHNAIQVIHKQSEHLLSLINDVLDLSKIEAQKLTFSFREFSLWAMFHNLVETFEYQAKNKGLNFELHLKESVPEFIYFEDERLKQILLNLCSNAIKFTEVGSICVVVDYQADTEQLYIEVKDTGIGLSEEQSRAIFQPFHQVADGDHNTKGTGLGLSISKQLTQALGGELLLQSEIGKGSSFKLQLPVKIVEMTANELTDIKPQAALAQECKILLAEDSVENGKLFQLILTNAGFDVDLVVNGEQALEHSQKYSYQLILLDIQMPILGGIEAHEMMRFSGVDCPIIALTANAMTHDVSKYLALGFTDCVTKPVKSQTLIQTISKHLQIDDDIKISQLPEALLSKLIADTKLAIKREVNILKGNDPTEVATFHKIKGMASQANLTEIADIADNLEKKPLETELFLKLQVLVKSL